MPLTPTDYRTLTQTMTTLRRAFLLGDQLVVQDLEVTTQMAYPLDQVSLLDTMAATQPSPEPPRGDAYLEKLARAQQERPNPLVDHALNAIMHLNALSHELGEGC